MLPGGLCLGGLCTAASVNMSTPPVAAGGLHTVRHQRLESVCMLRTHHGRLSACVARTRTGWPFTSPRMARVRWRGPDAAASATLLSPLMLRAA
jgi:hypothetical protein